MTLVAVVIVTMKMMNGRGDGNSCNFGDNDDDSGEDNDDCGGGVIVMKIEAI